jgi:hypothetical protein
MSGKATPPPVADEELLARFVLFSRWVRTRDQTIRPDAFIPHPWPDLSVTRHLGLSEAELWQLGQEVASQRPARLYGRADVQASTVRRQSLRIAPTPEPRNHANVTDWPADKPAQKIIAQVIAAAARYVPKPPLMLE